MKHKATRCCRGFFRGSRHLAFCTVLYCLPSITKPMPVRTISATTSLQESHTPRVVKTPTTHGAPLPLGRIRGGAGASGDISGAMPSLKLTRPHG
jgi:hypothetical protein